MKCMNKIRLLINRTEKETAHAKLYSDMPNNPRPY